MGVLWRNSREALVAIPTGFAVDFVLGSKAEFFPNRATRGRATGSRPLTAAVSSPPRCSSVYEERECLDACHEGGRPVPKLPRGSRGHPEGVRGRLRGGIQGRVLPESGQEGPGMRLKTAQSNGFVAASVQFDL